MVEVGIFFTSVVTKTTYLRICHLFASNKNLEGTLGERFVNEFCRYSFK